MSAYQDSEPAVVVTCACGGVVLMAVRKYLDCQDKAQIAKYVAEGHEVRQMPVSQCRGMGWCNCASAQGALDLPAVTA